MKILELLDRPDRWTKGANARNASGGRVDIHSDEAVRWCLDGGTVKCGVSNLATETKLKQACLSLYGTVYYGYWQDQPETTWEQVRALLVLADV